jgi:hypothetical protein
MQIRRSIIAATAAAAVLLPMAAATVAEAAPTATHDVLTTGKVGGTNVKAKANLSASLPKKGKVTFSVGTALGASCTDSSISYSVTKNPAKPGTADLNLTKNPVSKCTVTGSFKSEISKITVSLKKPPYKTTISDKKGFPVTVTSETLKVVAVTTIAGTLTCYFSAKTLKGSYSNKTQAVSFSKQTLDLVTSGSSSDCSVAGSKATYSVTYGPVKDTSVKGSPKVYVN